MKRVLFVLGQLSDTDLDWMISNGSKELVRRGNYLVTEGEVLEHIYIILSGEFRVFNAATPEVSIAQVSSGEIIGEMTLLDERPPSVSVIATEDSTVYSISLDKLKRYMEVDTTFAAHFYYAIALFLSDRLRKTTGRLGYGVPEAEDADEINLNVLGNIGQAGARFTRMLHKFSES